MSKQTQSLLSIPQPPPSPRHTHSGPLLPPPSSGLESLESVGALLCQASSACWAGRASKEEGMVIREPEHLGAGQGAVLSRPEEVSVSPWKKLETDAQRGGVCTFRGGTRELEALHGLIKNSSGQILHTEKKQTENRILTFFFLRVQTKYNCIFKFTSGSLVRSFRNDEELWIRGTKDAKSPCDLSTGVPQGSALSL